MTRDEAIEKALEHVRKVMGDNQIFRIMIAGEKNEIVAYEKHFPFDPPRRIPPKGTTVAFEFNGEGMLGIVYNEKPNGDGAIEILVSCLNFKSVFWVKDWVELAKVKP